MKHIIKHHYTSIEILEAIQYFNVRIDTLQGALQGVALHFPVLVKKYTHQIDIYNRCITRLNERYYRQLQKLIKN
jgi:hypothetical protein